MSNARRQQLLGYPKLTKPSIQVVQEKVEMEPPHNNFLPYFPPMIQSAQTLKHQSTGVEEERKIDSKMKDAQIQLDKIIGITGTERCIECGKQFSKKSNLKRHHQSEHCGKLYKYMRHSKLDERYLCVLCKRTYSHTYNLKNHILKHHSGAVIGKREVSFKAIQPRKRNQAQAISHGKGAVSPLVQPLDALMLQFDENTRSFLKEFKLKIPIIANILLEEPMQSPFDLCGEEDIEVRMIDQQAIKIYPMKGLIDGMTYQNRLLAEVSISRQSTITNANYVIHLEQLYLSFDHVALQFKRYQEDLRDYLRLRRDPQQLNDIFISILKGVRELHAMGFIHRDLKPDNVALSFDPLSVVLIDFNRSLLNTTTSEGTVLGTQGYFPMANKWRDGSIKWDLWAYAAMVLEADMPSDAYLHTKDERQAKQKFHQHSLHPHTSQALRDLVSKIFFAKRDEPLLTYEEIETLVKRIKFRKY